MRVAHVVARQWLPCVVVGLALSGCGDGGTAPPATSMLIEVEVCLLQDGGGKLCPAATVTPGALLEAGMAIDPQGGTLERVILEVTGLLAQADTFVPLVPTMFIGLLNHPDIKAVSFVGSSRVGEHIYTTGTAAGKRVQCMMGAKNHMVILPDADMDTTTEAVIDSIFGSTGQRCLAQICTVSTTSSVLRGNTTASGAAPGK